MINFGQQLKSLRLSHKITQKQLAESIGVSERGIQNYELNERKPTYDTLIAMADYFNVSLDYLVGRNDEKKNASSDGDFSPKEDELIKNFKLLDDVSKGKLIERSRMLAEESHPKNLDNKKKNA